VQDFEASGRLSRRSKVGEGARTGQRPERAFSKLLWGDIARDVGLSHAKTTGCRGHSELLVIFDKVGKVTLVFRLFGVVLNGHCEDVSSEALIGTRCV
jgi:hypothetical protein